jgi:hypothetical protein
MIARYALMTKGCIFTYASTESNAVGIILFP